MKSIAGLHGFVSAAAALCINAIPVGIVLGWGRSFATALVLYFIETWLGILLTVALLYLRAPAEDPAYAETELNAMTVTVNGVPQRRNPTRSRAELVRWFLIFALAFGGVPAIFLAFWIFGVAHVPLSWSAVASGITGMLAFQAVNFISQLFAFRSMTPAAAKALINQGMGRVGVIYLAVFAGMLLALFFSPWWFIIPFAILKTLVDVSYALQTARSVRSLVAQPG